MKITNLRACQPIAENSPPDWRTSLGQILIAIDTDVGLTGYGVGGGGRAGIHVALTVLRDLLLGRDPEPVETLWDEMYQATLAFGRKGLAIMALSGVDLALWDLRGKAQRRPIAEILGGSIATKVPTYATAWDEIPDSLIGRHSAFKLHVGKAADLTPLGLEKQVRQARQKIGAETPLFLDAWMRWTVPFTLEMSRILQPLNIGWIEEPLSPDDLAGYAELTSGCPIPIAGGEHEFTALGFADLIDRRLHQVLQPDVCWCGGMTELVKIYERGQSAGLRVCPHRGAEIWGLHAVVALDRDPLAETGRPWMTWVGGQPEIRDGFIQLSDASGFGVTIDETNLPVR